MGSLRDTLIAFVDEQLQAMLAAPGMWGSDESVELQALQLLQVRSVTVRPEFEKLHPRHVLESFHRFLKEEFPGAPPYPLFCLVEERGRKHEFTALLRKFWEQQRQEMGSADILMQHDLVIKIRLRDEFKMPRASMLSTYYDDFRRVLRAVSRRTGTRGHASRELEEAIDFVMPDVIVNPANGAAASIVLPLDQLPSSRAADVEQGLKKLVAVNEWAEEPGGSIDALKTRLDEERPERIAAQALRLMPEKFAQAIELGGKLVGRARPVTIRPHYAERMVRVVKQSPEVLPFDKVGVIRAIDIDQRSMRIRVDRQSIKCWLDGEELVKAALRGIKREIQVIGSLYKTPDSSDVVVVKKLVPRD